MVIVMVLPTQYNNKNNLYLMDHLCSGKLANDNEKLVKI